MRLEGALYTSREGMIAHGQALSVIGDNISNSNTIGYKRNRVEFSDLVTEGLDGRESTTITSGNGVGLNRVRSLLSETGGIDFTGRPLDVSIAGQGFFTVGTVDQTYYTRAGNFSMREDGVLVNSDNRSVLGIPANGTELGEINLLELDLTGNATSRAQIFGNLRTNEPIGVVPENPENFSDIGRSATSVSNFTVYDSVGDSHDLTFAFTKTEAGEWVAQVFINGGDIEGGTEGVPVQLGANAILRFNENGSIDAANAANAIVTANPNYANGSAAGNIPIDFSSFTQYQSSSVINGFSQDGQGAGQIKNYEFRGNGELYALLDSGSSILVGQLQLSYFPNLDGLQRVGNNLLFGGDDSGERQAGVAGSGVFGSIEGASLERSTVDLADQFVDLVLYQRGYQASSQILTTASQILRDTIALIR